MSFHLREPNLGILWPEWGEFYTYSSNGRCGWVVAEASVPLTVAESSELIVHGIVRVTNVVLELLF